MLSVNLNSVSLKNTNTEKRILDNIRFSLLPGKVYTILGQNGAGKSTLIKTLTRLLDKKIFSVNGEVKLRDENLILLSEEDIREIRKEKIKYVFQDAVNSFNHLKTFQYYFEQVCDNKETIEELCEFFLLPYCDTILELHPYEVSGGMAQRISLILALLAKPEIIILDEPTSAVDISIANLISFKLKEYCSGNNGIVLNITQDFEFALQTSDQIAYLSEGKLSPFISKSDLPELNVESLISYLRERVY